MADSDSDQQLHYVRGHTRPNRRRLSSNTVVTKPAGVHSGGLLGPSGNQEASGSEETLSAHESGMEEEEEGEEKWEKKGMSGDLARSAGLEKRTHDTHPVTKQKDSQLKKKSFVKVGKPPKRKRGQPSAGRDYKWSDSSDSDVEGGAGGREREADMRGTRRSRRSNKGNRLPRKDYNEGDSSPTPPKRRKLLRDTTTIKKPPAPKNLLGELLMDIPEIDICPLPTQFKSTNKGTSSQLQLQGPTSTRNPTIKPTIIPTTSKPTIIPTTSKARTSFTIEHKSTIPPKHATSHASGWVKTGNPKAIEMGTLKRSETTHKTGNPKALEMVTLKRSETTHKTGNPKALEMVTSKRSETTNKTSAKKHSCSPQDKVGQSSKELSSPSGKMVVKEQQRFGSSRGGTSTLLISKPPEIMLQSKQETASKTQKKIDEATANKTGTPEKSTKLSTHYKFLMSWEKDFFKGSMSTKAPVLYALDTIADKLATRKGPWLEKAKVIWNHWKKISPSLHEFYVNKAKENRVKLQERTAEKKLRKLQASLSSSQRLPGVAVHSRQTSHIGSVLTIPTHPLVVSKATKLTAIAPSTTPESKLPSQMSPHVMGISVNPNMSVQKPASIIKDIKSEDLCNAVDKEIETLEETLGTSPPAVPFSPRSMSLSPHSPTLPATSRLRSPTKLKQLPSKSSPPTSMCTTTTSGQESHQRSAGTEASKWKLSGSGIYLPSATELSSFCASPALISPLCPISPTCTQPPSTSSTACEGAVAVTPTSSVLSLPLTPLLPPRISSVLKYLSSPNIEVPTLSPQPASDGSNSMALSSQQFSMKQITRSTSASPKQKRSAKSNSETKSGAVPLIQKAKKSTSSSSLTGSDPFLQNLLANVCLQNQPYFKHLQTPPNVSTGVANTTSSATTSKKPALSSSSSTTDTHNQSLCVSPPSQPTSKPMSHLTSRSSSFSTSSIGSTVANPMTQLTTINTVQTIPHSTITALLSTSTSNTVPQTTTIIPGACQTHPVSRGLNASPKTQSSSSGTSAEAVSTFSLPLLSSSIAPGSTAAPISRHSITAGTSPAPIPTSASTSAMKERQSNTDGTCAVVVPLSMFSLPIPRPTSTTGSLAKTTMPQSIAGNTMSTTSAVIPSSTITSSSASDTPNLGLRACKLDSHTAEVATLPLSNTTETKPVSVPNPISTVSSSALELSVHNPSMQDTCAGKATPYIPSFPQHTSATVPTSGLQLDHEAQTINAGSATMPTLSFLASSSNTTPMSDECASKPEAQNLHGGDTASSPLQSCPAIASSAAVSHLQPNIAKPETHPMHSNNTASSAIALAPATSTSILKPAAQENTTMPLPNTLEPTATNALGPPVKEHQKKKHARKTISKAERLSKHGTKISLPHKPPSFMLPVFPSESQSAHIPPSLLAASISRAQPKSSHTSKLKGESCPSKTAETATSFHTQNPFSSLSGPSFQSKFLPSNIPSVTVAHQQQQQQKQKQQQQKQQQKQQWKCYSLMSSRGSLTFPGLGPEITPSSPPDLPHTFSRDSQMEQHTQQQNFANPFQSTSASGNQNRPLTLHIASTSANVQDLPSDLRLHQQPSSSSTSPSLSSPSPTTTLPSSKAAKERNPGSSKSPLYIASPSLLREFPEIEAVSKLHSRALGASAMGTQYGTAHTGPFPAPKYEFKPFLCSELSNLPSFTSLGLPSASPRLKTEALDIDNKGTIQFYSDTPTSVTDNGESTPNHSTVGFSGPQIGTTSTSQPVIGSSSLFAPQSNPGSASIANAFFSGLENLTPSQRSTTLVPTLSTAAHSKDSQISTTPTLSLFSTAAAGPSKDSPSIVTASVSAESKTASADSNDWRLKLLQKLQDRLKQQDKGQIELKSEPRSDKQLTGKLTSTKGKKPTQSKKRQRHSSTSSSISGLFTPPLTPLSSSLSSFSLPPSRPRPMMVTPEQPCKDFLLQENRPQGSLPTPSSETGEVNPTLEINPPIGDFSRWELERLYVYNLAVLEHQWKYTKMLEKKLLKMEQESVSKKPSKLEVYQRFLEFVVEPAHFPDAPAINFPELSSEEIELQGTFDKPILDKNHDFYASFSRDM